MRCRGNGFQIELLAGLRLNLRRVDEAIPAYPDIVGAFRQVGQQVTALIIRDHDFHVSGRQVPGFGDHPHAGFGTFGARDNAGDITGIDFDLFGCGALRCRPADGSGTK